MHRVARAESGSSQVLRAVPQETRLESLVAPKENPRLNYVPLKRIS
jgi:hypothetical protein